MWLLRRSSSELSAARRNVARAGRLRWLQKVETDEAAWDAFEAAEGVPFSSLVTGGKRLPWATLRHWLHDMASELWAARKDDTLPAELSLDHVWITGRGQAVLLDNPWPANQTPAECFPVGDIREAQRLLRAIAAFVEATSIPLHARPALKNLADGRFEKLSFLTGTLRGLVDTPAEVGQGIRAGAIFMFPVYTLILCLAPYLSRWEDAWSGGWEWFGSVARYTLIAAMAILAIRALVQLLEMPFRSTMSHSTFRLAVVNAQGELTGIPQRLLRWAVVWLPLFLPVSLVVLLTDGVQTTGGFAAALIVVCLWTSAAVYAALHPHQGLHDRLAGTWVVRR